MPPYESKNFLLTSPLDILASYDGSLPVSRYLSRNFLGGSNRSLTPTHTDSHLVSGVHKGKMTECSGRSEKVLPPPDAAVTYHRMPLLRLLLPLQRMSLLFLHQTPQRTSSLHLHLPTSTPDVIFAPLPAD